MDISAEVSRLMMDGMMIVVAVVISIFATGIVNPKVVFEPDGFNIKNRPTQIFLAFLIACLTVLSV